MIDKRFEIFDSNILALERWGCIQDGLVLFQNQFMTGVVMDFEWGEVLFKSGVAFKRIRYLDSYFILVNFVPICYSIDPVPNIFGLASEQS